MAVLFWLSQKRAYSVCGMLMSSQTNKNRLPMKDADGVASKTHFSKQLFSRFKIFREQTKTVAITLAGFMILYLLGYQPAWGLLPIQKSTVYAQSLGTSTAILAPTPTPSPTATPSALPISFTLPFTGYLSTTFSWGHPGIDIATGLGTPIHPIASGRVSEVHYTFFGYGYYVVIDHENGYKSLYGHMGRIFVRENDRVEANSIIGEVGLTGRTSGPHLHLEILNGGQYVNPVALLPAISNEPQAYPTYITAGQQQTPVKEVLYGQGGPIILEQKPEKTKDLKLDLKKELKFNL
jgi:murein DD-endopeptidase MepM/ murein hydrolase activator NlpD